MSTYTPFKPVEPRNPHAAYVDREFIKGLIDNRSRHIIPRFDATSNALLGVTITGPRSVDTLEANLNDYIVQHPDGGIEVMEPQSFIDRYQFRD